MGQGTKPEQTTPGEEGAPPPGAEPWAAEPGPSRSHVLAALYSLERLCESSFSAINKRLDAMERRQRRFERELRSLRATINEQRNGGRAGSTGN
ncbi:UNVERIFIED_CONTAM: hypothetical protein K2H54_020367 [Gekko kuhli]